MNVSNTIAIVVTEAVVFLPLFLKNMAFTFLVNYKK